MKICILYGSPRKKNTYAAVQQIKVRPGGFHGGGGRYEGCQCVGHTVVKALGRPQDLFLRHFDLCPGVGCHSCFPQTENRKTA